MNAAVYNAVIFIIKVFLRLFNGLEVYVIRLGIKRNGHFVIAGIDCINIYVRPGGDGEIRHFTSGYLCVIC